MIKIIATTKQLEGRRYIDQSGKPILHLKQGVKVESEIDKTNNITFSLYRGMKPKNLK